MDPSQVIMLIVLIILLLLSAFFSSAETALVSVNQITLISLKESGNKKADTAIKCKENTPKMLSAILIGNNIVNISASALATMFAISFTGDQSYVGLATGILTLLVLILGEITPKSYATNKSVRLALLYAPIISFLMFIFTPVIIIINQISGFLLKLIGGDIEDKSETYTEDEIRTIVSVGHEEGVIESEEKAIINNLFDFGDSVAKDVMIPRIDITCVPDDITFSELVHIFNKDKYTRIPVYKDSSDDIIGIINVKDLLLYFDPTNKKENFNIHDVMREPYYTFEYKKVSELMNEMRAQSISLAIVVDEYSQTVGMITLEDLLEEIVGEIRDEYDEDEKETFKQVDEHTFIMDGTTKLDFINDTLGLSLYSEEYDSIAGLIIEKLDDLPDVNDTVIVDGISLHVKAMEKNRIETVEIKILNNMEEKIIC